MITNLNYIGKNGTLLSYDLNGKNQSILFDDINKYWSYCNEEDFEGGISYIIDDDKILFTIMVANGQGGVLVIWDTKNNIVTHITNADFCVAANIFNNALYYLCEINYYAMPTHYKVFSIPIGVIDINNMGSELFCDNPRKIRSREKNDIFEIVFDEKSLSIKCGNNLYPFVSDIMDSKNQFPQKKFKNYYEALDTVQSKALHGDMSEYRMIENMLL